MTAPKLTRIPWPKGEFETTAEWLTSLAPKPPPTAAEAERRLPPQGGSELGGRMSPPWRV
jgi:hypothetical protein